jgi:hypothetical protein
MLAVLLVLMLSACATATKTSAPAPGVALDADPNNLQIEIGRYSALLGQVVEHTVVAYDHAASDAPPEGPQALMSELRDAVKDYNAVRASLCASKGEASFAAIRQASCGAAFQPRWNDRAAVTFETVAQRSHEAGAPIIGLWDDVCAEAKRLQPADQKDEPVCPME